MIKKTQEVKEVKVAKTNVKGDLKNYLNINMPGMFDRDPDITGNLDTFVDEIINITK